jgi:hypothetical protein
MPVMGPNRSVDGKMLENLAHMIYYDIADCVFRKVNNYSLLSVVHKSVSFCVYGPNAKRDYDYNRRVYLIYGWLKGLLPNTKLAYWISATNYQGEKDIINPEKFNFTVEQFRDWLGDLLFDLDCEDF